MPAPHVAKQRAKRGTGSIAYWDNYLTAAGRTRTAALTVRQAMSGRKVSKKRSNLLARCSRILSRTRTKASFGRPKRHGRKPAGHSGPYMRTADFNRLCKRAIKAIESAKAGSKRSAKRREGLDAASQLLDQARVFQPGISRRSKAAAALYRRARARLAAARRWKR